MNISEDHRIFTSRVATSGIINSLRERLLPLNTSGRCADTAMTATGIPPHIDLQRQVQGLNAENVLMRNLLIKHHIEVMEELPAKVTANIIRNINIEGTHQMGRDEMKAMMRELLMERDAKNGNGTSENNNNASSSAATTSTTKNVANGFTFWTWGNKLRPVPENWSMPRTTVKHGCDLFIVGIPTMEIRPLRKIMCCTLRRNDQAYFSKAEMVFNRLVTTAIARNLTTSEAMKSITMAEWDTIFKQTYEYELIQLGKNGIPKKGEVHYTTFYNWIREHKN